MKQLTHDNSFFNLRKFPITVVCDEVYFQQNIGSIFRICDAFGVEKIFFTGEDFIFTERKINKTSRNTHKKIPFEIIKNKKQVLEHLVSNHFNIISLEITTSSIPLHMLTVDKLNSPIALIIGNEIKGISEEFLKTSNIHTHISMFGVNSSMNVTQSLSICLYHFTKLLFNIA